MKFLVLTILLSSSISYSIELDCRVNLGYEVFNVTVTNDQVNWINDDSFKIRSFEEDEGLMINAYRFSATSRMDYQEELSIYLPDMIMGLTNSIHSGLFILRQLNETIESTIDCKLISH